MCIRYRIHRNLQLVHTIITHNTNGYDLRAYSDQLRNDPDFDAAFDHLIEFSMGDPESSRMVPAQVLSQLVPPIARIQMAIVAPGDQEFGIARQFQAIYEFPDEVFSVFRDQSKALSWFGLESTQVDQVDWGGWRTVSAEKREEGKSEVSRSSSPRAIGRH